MPDDSAVLEGGSLAACCVPGSGEARLAGAAPATSPSATTRTTRRRRRSTFPLVDGVRYAVPGDRASRRGRRHAACCFGRDSVTINTGGEKVFAEEVEHALKHHPDVWDTVVVGTPHERWGQQVTALVKLRAGAAPDEDALRGEVRTHLADYKVPKVFVFVDELVRAPSGKADYRWAKAVALEHLGHAPGRAG